VAKVKGKRAETKLGPKAGKDLAGWLSLVLSED